jgi:asparagine synthase (glutamine-hydrolysing)
MCGIAGVIDYASVEPKTSHELLRSMSDVIRHRGPDDDGHWLSPDRRCGFAFRRLAIIDLSPAGHQPMATSDERFTIVFNGEIYNHADLRRDLEAKGYTYRSRTDTESLLYGFREYGPELVHKLVGMWALAVWDNERQELFCARDRIGIKPLYYYHRDGKFIFGSEIKSLLQHPDVLARMNLDELPNYLSFSMSSEHSTLFENIHKLPRGHYLKLNRQGEIQIREYWNPLIHFDGFTKLDEAEVIDEIMRLLRQAVKDRMMSDVPFGVFLSGGIDSSVNVALMAELMNRPVDTYSVGFSELEKYNELGYARRVASLFKTNHREILIDHADALPVLEDLVWHEDEPNGDPVCIPLYFLSKLTRESGTIVVQVGEGSDEQFVGYPWMLRDIKFHDRYARPYAALPRPLRAAAYSMVRPAFVGAKQFQALDYLRRVSQGDQVYWGGGVDLTPSHLSYILGRNYSHLARLSSALPERLHARAEAAGGSDIDYVQRIAFYELAHRLPELLLMRVDKMTMANSIEARVPFLDHRLVEFTMTIPRSIKIPNPGVTKHLLKKAVESILPSDIIYRPKQGFAAPMPEWFRGPWYSYCESTLLNSPLVKQSIFDGDAIKSLLAAHKSGKRNFGKSLYALVNLALWHRRFID